MNTAARILRENNPFSTNAATNPWDTTYPDVMSIHEDVFLGISHLVERKSDRPREPLAVLVLGETGSGKTHFLQRVLQLTEQEHSPSTFVNIRPLLNPKAPMRHLLRGIITDLDRDMPDMPGCTKLQSLLSLIVRDYIISTKNEDFKDLAAKEGSLDFFNNTRKKKKKQKKLLKKAIQYLNSLMPGMNAPFLETLFRPDTEKNREAFFDALVRRHAKGKSPKKKGATKREKNNEYALEDIARDGIISLGDLLQKYEKNAIICFDQLDNLKTPELIDAFGTMVHTLVNETYAMVPVAFVRPDSWNNVFRMKLDPAARDRLEMNTFVLSGCSLAQADTIIRTRIQFNLKDNWEGPYQWLSACLKGILKEGYSPRQVILLANRSVQSTGNLCEKQKSPVAVLKGHYENEYSLIRSQSDTWRQNSDILLFALENLLKSMKDVKDIEKKSGTGIDLTATITGHLDADCRYSFIVNTHKSHNSVRSSFEHGIRDMKWNQSKCIYITEQGCDYSKPGWKKTNKKLKEFLETGGKIWNLENGEAERWYALASLIFKITDGDITTEGEGGVVRRVQYEELQTFIGSEFHLHF